MHYGIMWLEGFPTVPTAISLPMTGCLVMKTVLRDCERVWLRHQWPTHNPGTWNWHRGRLHWRNVKKNLWSLRVQISACQSFKQILSMSLLWHITIVACHNSDIGKICLKDWLFMKHLEIDLRALYLLVTPLVDLLDPCTCTLMWPITSGYSVIKFYHWI